MLAVNTTTKDVITAKTNYSVSTPKWLKRGDWIQLGQGLDARLYKVLNDVNVNASGSSGNIHLWPAFRNIPVEDQVIIINSPRGLFRRSSGSYSYSEVDGCKYSLSFDCEEVV